MTAEPAIPSAFPDTLAVFPLNAVLFPRSVLPLNIFEPRYLNMFDDAMASHKMIGMIQPFSDDRAAPMLAKVGCVGRISSYSETSDGRYKVILTGATRFRVKEELSVQTPYRQVSAEYDLFADDLEEPTGDMIPDRLRLEAALQIYADNQGSRPDWDAFHKMPMELLIHALIANCPFRPIEKQALLEAPDLQKRSEILITLFSQSDNDTNEKHSGHGQ